jgi:hypothetical protein
MKPHRSGIPFGSGIAKTSMQRMEQGFLICLTQCETIQGELVE